MVRIPEFEVNRYNYEVGERIEVLYIGMGYITGIKKIEGIPVYIVELDNKKIVEKTEDKIQRL